MYNTNLASLNFFTHKMDVNFDMLRSLVLNRIPCYVNGTHIVTVNYGSASGRSAQVQEEIANLTDFGYNVCNPTVFPPPHLNQIS